MVGGSRFFCLAPCLYVWNSFNLVVVVVLATPTGPSKVAGADQPPGWLSEPAVSCKLTADRRWHWRWQINDDDEISSYLGKRGSLANAVLCCRSCQTWGGNVDWGGWAKEDPRNTVGFGCKFYEKPNQKFEPSKYSTILWTWKLLTWPQATLAEHCWKALSQWLQWSEHSHVWGHWVWYWIAFMCFSMPLKRSPKNPPLGFLKIFLLSVYWCSWKAPKIWSISTLGTALVLDLGLVAPLVGQSRGLPPYALLVERPFPPVPGSLGTSLETR